MKKGIIIVVAIIAVILIGGVSQYNGLVSKQETIENAKATIDTTLQRRLDLIPNLVNTVKGYAKHEQGIIDGITDAREKMAGATTTEDKLKANDELTDAVSRLLLVIENYPNLKADTQFTNLQDELAGTENRIANARREYNDAVKTYNTAIKKFPGKIFAGIFGFEAETYFEASAGAENAPSVEF